MNDAILITLMIYPCHEREDDNVEDDDDDDEVDDSIFFVDYHKERKVTTSHTNKRSFDGPW